MVKESRIAQEKEVSGEVIAKNTAVKAGLRKPAVKKRSPKAEAAHKRSVDHVKQRNVKAKSKAPVKKAVAKKPKTELGYKPNNIVKVTSDDFPRAEFRMSCLKVIRRTRTKKVGYLIEAIQNKLGVTELRALKAMEGLRDKGYISFK